MTNVGVSIDDTSAESGLLLSRKGKAHASAGRHMQHCAWRNASHFLCSITDLLHASGQSGLVQTADNRRHLSCMANPNIQRLEDDGKSDESSSRIFGRTYERTEMELMWCDQIKKVKAAIYRVLSVGTTFNNICNDDALQSIDVQRLKFTQRIAKFWATSILQALHFVLSFKDSHLNSRLPFPFFPSTTHFILHDHATDRLKSTIMPKDPGVDYENSPKNFTESYIVKGLGLNNVKV